MKVLNHPLKRLFFTVFVLSGLLTLILSLVPSPIETKTRTTWKKANAAESVDRTMITLDLDCAEHAMGDPQRFAEEFWVAYWHSYEEPSDVLEWMMEDRLVLETDTRRFHADRIAAMRSVLHQDSRICRNNVCVERLDPELLDSMLQTCSTAVGQQLHTERYKAWVIDENLKDALPVSAFALYTAVISFLLLLFSLVYRYTLGPLFRWIWTGSWKRD